MIANPRSITAHLQTYAARIDAARTMPELETVREAMGETIHPEHYPQDCAEMREFLRECLTQCAMEFGVSFRSNV